MNLQPAHFFDKLSAAEGGVVSPGRAYLMLDASTGRYVFTDTLPTSGQVYLVPGTGGRLELSTSPAGAVTPSLYGTNRIVL